MYHKVYCLSLCLCPKLLVLCRDPWQRPPSTQDGRHIAYGRGRRNRQETGTSDIAPSGHYLLLLPCTSHRTIRCISREDGIYTVRPVVGCLLLATCQISTLFWLPAALRSSTEQGHFYSIEIEAICRLGHRSHSGLCGRWDIEQGIEDMSSHEGRMRPSGV